MSCEYNLKRLNMGRFHTHLRQQLVEKTLDAKRLNFRVDQESAVRLHYARTEGHGGLGLHLQK